MSAITGHAARFEARTITQGRDVDNQSKLSQFKQVFAAKTQLAVYNPATHQHIATGVSKTQLSSLIHVDPKKGLSSENMRSAENILHAAGIQTAHLSIPDTLSLAVMAVTDPGRAADIAQLKSVGLDAPQMMNPDFRHGLAELSRTNVGAATALSQLHAATGGAGLSGSLPSDLGAIPPSSPGLVGKILTLAQSEATGALPPGVTSYMASRAKEDPYMWDNKSALDPSTLPTAATLGFEPKFHVTLDQATYTNVASGLRRLQAEGHVPNMRFDDAARTIHSGYGHIALSDIVGGMSGQPRNDGTGTIAQRDGKAFTKAVFDSLPRPPMQEGTVANALLAERGFGNPAYSAARQQQRFDAVLEMFTKYDAFDYTAHDATFSPGAMNTLQQTLNGQTDSQKITELLVTQDFDGFSISEKHSDTTSKRFLFDNLADLKTAGVTVVVIEHMKHSEFSTLLDAYFATPPNTPMSRDLTAALKTMDDVRQGPDSIGGIIRKMHDDPACSGMRVVGADTENLNPSNDTAHKYEVRMGAMNVFGENNIRAALQPGEKFVMLAGGAHNNTHVGLTNGMPGFSQTFGIPAVRVAPTGAGGFTMTLDLDDPGKRTAATAGRPS